MRSLAIILLLAACGTDSVPHVPDGPPEPPPTPFTECDSDPGSFIRDSFLAITGRRPLGQAEVEVYRALWTQAEAQGLDPRTTVATALTRTPEFRPRWESALMDALRVQRIDVQSMQACWGSAGEETVTPDLAQQIRDTDAALAAPRGTSTMLDVARSALALDDLSTVYRAQLFNLVSLPPGTANVGPVEAELAQRADLGGTFDSAWLRRDTVCLGCHNSEASVTDSDDPAIDRHWPVAGLPEKAVYGVSSGVAGARAHGMFRISGFVFAGDTTPWGLSESCGQFAAPGTVPDDLADVDTKLGSLTGKRTTVYELDAALRRGFDRLRGRGPTLADGAIADPDEALAWLVTMAIAEEVWREIVGSPLTIANGFPRNRGASELLTQIATELAVSGYSLKHLVTKIVTTDFFSRQAPEAGCGAAYGYPAVFDPWTTSELDPEHRGNGPGDAIAWLAPRTLAIAASGALWNGVTLAAPFPSEGGAFCTGSCEELTGFCDEFAFCCAEAQAVCGAGESPNQDGVAFQRSVGIYLRNSEPGSRGLSFQARLAWEDRFGSCGKPDTAPATPDFIDEVLAAAKAQPDATVVDVVRAVKDRIVGEPVIQAGESPALEALLGPITAPASTVDPAAVRHLCGVLLGSPQFTMSGLPGRDGEIPRLTPEAGSFGAVCARLDGVALGEGRRVTCVGGAIAIATP
ncbi:MAG: hypothetical protein H0V17_08905 [Deltaproteobacteria bacterium]|nr:hypothetical protein [Deltaproteobacteria bacterium]